MKPIRMSVAGAMIYLLCVSSTLAQSPNRLAAVSMAPMLKAQCLAVLHQALTSDEFWPAMHAAEALTLAGETNSVRAALATRLPAERDDQRRCGLARELVRAGDRQPLAILEHILADANSTGRVHAAESLYKLGETGAAEQLRAASKQSAKGPLQLWATAALAKSGDKACLAELRASLRSEARASRSTAAFALARLGDTSDVDALSGALVTETDPFARVILAGALACQGHAGGRAELGRQLESADAGVRAISADLVGASRSVEYQSQLVALLQDDALDVRVRAAQSLLGLSQPATPLQDK
ncbi:MAG: HEAT repeat domain-containing protein [Pirellulales bacterium]